MKLRLVALLLSATVLAGCPAVYPVLGTRTRPIPAGQPLDPPPPAELRWVRSLLEELRAGKLTWDLARILAQVRAARRKSSSKTSRYE